MQNKIIIGLTGSFGSGCGTLRNTLEKRFQFRSFKLSEEVKEEAKRQKLNHKDRDTLQSIGNSLREENGSNYLANKAIQKADEAGQDKIVFHGIRNVGEIREFRKSPNFYLVAVDCSRDTRWKRLKDGEIYKGNEAIFDKHDARDKDEDLWYGQQVLKCVEESDILFINENDWDTDQKKIADMEERFRSYIGLITGEELRNPNQSETKMTLASTLALQSHCIKRRVGALLCDSFGHIVAGAYNEVPPGQQKCFELYRMCYRDHIRHEFNQDIVKSYSCCPSCGKSLFLNGFKCKECEQDLGENISHYKALDKCRALHAEETTLLKAPNTQLEGSILYTTTFPCLQCAKRIIQCRISEIYYIDPYPEKEAVSMLETAKIKTTKFSGVKAQAYYKLFQPYQELLENEVQKTIN